MYHGKDEKKKKKMMYGGTARKKMMGGGMYGMKRKKMMHGDHTIIWTELAWLWVVQWMFKNLTNES